MIRTHHAFLLPSLNRSQVIRIGVIGVWVLAMIALPIARWIWGEGAVTWGVVGVSLFQVMAVFAILVGDWGWQRTLRTLIVVAMLTTLAEILGSRTGIPFGDYRYTEALQPQILGVPLLIPLAWFMMLPPAWAVAQAIVGRERRLAFIVVSAVALTAWDLFLDPQKVAWGFWVWAEPGGYFGVPWTNYLGWLLVAALVTWVARPGSISLLPMLLIYGIVWIFQTIGQALFWNQPGPALVGFIGMGLVLLAVVWSQRSQWTLW
ncbi:MAG: carotenoid biosynthesis protein [Anaerolineae bacterium]|nr:carotenoid biosynthesis protein [Anaerolineae bacterium]